MTKWLFCGVEGPVDTFKCVGTAKCKGKQRRAYTRAPGRPGDKLLKRSQNRCTQST